jgi:hypothetical protein
MNILEENGLIELIKTSSESTFYHVTNKGVNAYSKWVKDFLDFTRFTHNKLTRTKKRVHILIVVYCYYSHCSRILPYIELRTIQLLKSVDCKCLRLQLIQNSTYILLCLLIYRRV